MPRKLAHLVAGLALVVVAATAAVALAQAGSRELKNTGAVGETLNGYLAVTDGGANRDVRGEVETINAARRETYLKAAQDAGRPLAEVEAVAGARLREMAQPGDWIQDAAGNWVQKQ